MKKKKKHSIRYQAYQDIRRNEFAELRRSKAPVTLPAVRGLAHQTQRPILRGEKRQHLINDVIDAMRDSQPSPFRWEAALRHGLRKWLCIDGYAWARADFEAEAVTSEALRVLGATRPSPDEAHWQHTVSPDYCLWCQGPLDEDRTKRQRFCSVKCARSAMVYRRQKGERVYEGIGQSAYMMIRRKESPPRPCKTCGEPFQSAKAHVQYCSAKCVRAAKGDLIGERQCLHCDRTFAPSSRSMVCCSHACAQTRRIEQFRASVPERSCECCQAIFRPANTQAKYCSLRCAQLVAKRAFQARLASEPVVDRPKTARCAWCHSQFAPRTDKTKTCNGSCSAYLSRARAGIFQKTLTGPIFDYVFGVAA
jgi:hypothetical protein